MSDLSSAGAEPLVWCDEIGAHLPMSALSRRWGWDDSDFPRRLIFVDEWVDAQGRVVKRELHHYVRAIDDDSAAGAPLLQG